jgi:glyoxylase-like metal-dependent hydrolase (beta-lactamase superfamily II)
MINEEVSPLPIKYAFITHHHADHGGLNQKVIDSGAELIGQAKLVNILKNYKSVIAPINPAAPSITFEDEYKLDFGGTQTIAYHWGSSHTNADIAVYFQDLKVVAVGDLVYGNALPAVDAHSGHGSLLGMRARLDDLLTLDFEIAIPGHGSKPMLRDEVAEYKRQLDDLIRFGSLALKNGASVDNFVETMDEQSSDFKLLGHFWREQTGLISIFNELKAYAEDEELGHAPLL